MRKFIIFCCALLILFNCSSDDSSDNQEDQLVDGGVISRYQLVSVQVNGLNTDNYTGSINGVNVELKRTDVNTLTFFVIDEISTGNNILEIDGLEKRIRYEVEETILETSVETTLESLTSNFNNYANSLANNTPQENYVTHVIDNFNSTLEQIEEEEKETIARVYQANKLFFDSLYQTDYSIPQRNALADYSNLSNVQLVINFTTATVGAGVATAGAILSLGAVNPIVTLAFAVAAIPLWQISYDLWNEIIFNRLWVFIQLKWDEITSFVMQSRTTMMSSLEFQTGVQKVIDFDATSRGFGNSDSSSTNQIISSFFSSHDDLNEIIDDLNSVINFVNNIPFTNIPLIDNLTVGDANEESLNATQELFNNLNLTIDDPNVQMSTTFANGNLNITLSILDETVVTDFVETSIRYTYQDDTNDFTGSFPVKISLENENEIDLTGSWSFVPNAFENDFNLL